jgi:hypothetical protein
VLTRDRVEGFLSAFSGKGKKWIEAGARRQATEYGEGIFYFVPASLFSTPISAVMSQSTSRIVEFAYRFSRQATLILVLTAR